MREGQSRARRRARHGGATRILIIDDDRRPAGPARPLLPGPSLVRSQNGSAGSPIREFTVPTPVPGALPRLDLVEAGGAPVEADPEMVRDLVARVQALLAGARRHEEDARWPEATIAAGEFTLDLPLQAVSRGGRTVRVTQTEFRLLFALVRRRGAIASRQELLREVWAGDPSLTARVVDTHVARLRRKLEDDPRQPRHILTALASGYRFRA